MKEPFASLVGMMKSSGLTVVETYPTENRVAKLDYFFCLAIAEAFFLERKFGRANQIYSIFVDSTPATYSCS